MALRIKERRLTAVPPSGFDVGELLQLRTD
jgi:hypothetical protein